MSIYERYMRTRGAALEGISQARARLEAAERRRAAEAAQQVAAGQLLLHDPEVRLAMGPEQEAEAYERLNGLEASLGLKPTPYVDVPKQEFAKHIYAGQVKVAEQALPAAEREALLDSMAGEVMVRFGPARVARYMVSLRNEQTLMQAQQAASGQGRAAQEATPEPPMGARQWVRSLLEPHAPPAVEGTVTSSAQPTRAGERTVPVAAGAPGDARAKARSAAQATAPPARPEQTQQPECPARSIAPYQLPEPVVPRAPEVPATAPTPSPIALPGPGAPAGQAAPAARPGVPAARPAGRPAPRAGRQHRAPSLTDPLEPDVEQWRHLVEQYFPADQVENALHVIQAESSGIANRHNDNPGTGDDSWGLFQINRFGRLADSRPPAAQLVHPEFNIRYAAEMWRNQGWGPWTTARHMGLAPAAHRRERRPGHR